MQATYLLPLARCALVVFGKRSTVGLYVYVCIRIKSRCTLNKSLIISKNVYFVKFTTIKFYAFFTSTYDRETKFRLSLHKALLKGRKFHSKKI
jgi:hypothetical protein